MTIHVTPIPSTIELATPAFVLGTSNIAGAAPTAVSSDSTLLAFDTTVPADVAGSAAVGTAVVPPRRDHVHVGVTPSAAVFTGNVDLGANLLVGNAGTTGISISAAGEVTMAAQPCVSARNSVTDNNLTGDGGSSTVDFDDVLFDQDDNFADDTFTAPVGGRYLFATMVRFNGLSTSGTTIRVNLVSTLATASIFYENASLPRWVGPTPGGSIIVEMDPNDTVIITMMANGMGAAVVGVIGGPQETYFSACMVA